jgi:hypothetical protein
MFMNNVTSGVRHQLADDVKNDLAERHRARISVRSRNENPSRPTLYTAAGKVS